MEKQLQIGSEKITYRRVPAKARQVRVILRVEQNMVIVSAPLQVTEKTIEFVLVKHVDWIVEQLKKTELITKRMLQLGDSITINDMSYTLVSLCQPSGSKDASVQLDEISQRLWVNQLVPAADVHRVVYTWLRAEANRSLLQFAHQLAIQYGFTPARITVKEQARRWGSCSSKGNIHLNWRLIQAPLYVQRYVIIHELAHLREMNHSAQFWRIVEDMMPDYEQAKSWLRVRGNVLYRLQPEEMTFTKPTDQTEENGKVNRS